MCRIGRRVPYRNHLLILLLLDVTVVVDKIFTNSSDNITSIAKLSRPSVRRVVGIGEVVAPRHRILAWESLAGL